MIEGIFLANGMIIGGALGALGIGAGSFMTKLPSKYTKAIDTVTSLGLSHGIEEPVTEMFQVNAGTYNSYLFEKSNVTLFSTFEYKIELREYDYGSEFYYEIWYKADQMSILTPYAVAPNHIISSWTEKK